MTVQLKSAYGLSQANGVKVLVYGNAGAGKTVLCATAPNPVIISAESGLLSLRKVIDERRKAVNNPKFDIPIIEINSVAALLEAHKWATSSKEAEQFQTIAIDSISEIGEVLLSTEKAKTKDPRQAYGELITIGSDIVRKFRDLPNKHVIISAKMEKEKDEATGAMLYQPSMPGSKLGPQLPYFFDEVFNLFVGTNPTTQQQYRALKTARDFQYEAKDRSGKLDALEPADLTHIINKIMS